MNLTFDICVQYFTKNGMEPEAVKYLFSHYCERMEETEKELLERNAIISVVRKINSATSKNEAIENLLEE